LALQDPFASPPFRPLVDLSPEAHRTFDPEQGFATAEEDAIFGRLDNFE
jgi:hypothetical protein